MFGAAVAGWPATVVGGMGALASGAFVAGCVVVSGVPEAGAGEVTDVTALVLELSGVALVVGVMVISPLGDVCATMVTGGWFVEPLATGGVAGTVALLVSGEVAVATLVSEVDGAGAVAGAVFVADWSVD